jgi:hypothetical protein
LHDTVKNLIGCPLAGIDIPILVFKDIFRAPENLQLCAYYTKQFKRRKKKRRKKAEELKVVKRKVDRFKCVFDLHSSALHGSSALHCTA